MASSVRPLIGTSVPKAWRDAGDGDEVADFIEALCKVTKSGVGADAGSLLEMRPWQVALLRDLYARNPRTGRLKHRQALIGLPRKNGKSALGSALALHALITGDPGTEVYSCAGSLDQARIVFETAKRMVAMQPALSEVIKPYQRVLEVPATGNVYKVLSADAPMQEGLNPSLVIFDELHVQPNYELWNVMNLAFGARLDPLLVAITTAGVKYQSDGRDTVCYWLYQYIQRIASGEIDDPQTYGAWFGAAEDEPYDQVPTWQRANPGYGDLLDPEDFASKVKVTPEAEFRTKRLNQFVSHDVAWLPQGAWEDARRDDVDASDVWALGVDGARSGTAVEIVRSGAGEVHRVETVARFEAPLGLGPNESWTPPEAEIAEVIRNECRERQVAEIAWQEFFLPSLAEQLESEGLPVVVFNQTLTRMGPATQRFYEAVLDGKLSHDGSPALARSIAAAKTKTDTRGTRLVRTEQSIGAICAVMAYDRAVFQSTNPDRPGYFHGKRISEIRYVW